MFQMKAVGCLPLPHVVPSWCFLSSNSEKTPESGQTRKAQKNHMPSYLCQGTKRLGLQIGEGSFWNDAIFILYSLHNHTRYLLWYTYVVGFVLELGVIMVTMTNMEMSYNQLCNDLKKLAWFTGSKKKGLPTLVWWWADNVFLRR